MSAQQPSGDLEYYQQAALWDENSGYASPVEQDRADHLAELVLRSGAQTILDAGAGNGIVANRLLELGVDIVALDHSDVAMTGVRTRTVVGDIAMMPFEDNSFDLVLASEVLEHLPVDVFDAARSELARVASRAVIVTVPNRESLYAAGVTCPLCQTRSSPWRHMRSFTEGTLTDLIPGFRPSAIEAYGPMVDSRGRLEAVLIREALRRSVWPATSICPQCGYRVSELKTNRSAALPPLRRRVARLFRPRAQKWIVATFIANQ
jgi:SAM-dependent methyltransferase